MILVGSSDLALRSEVEQDIVKRFSRCTTMAIPSTFLFSPLKSYTMQDIENIIKEQKFDAIIVIEPTDIGTDTITVPGRATINAYGSIIYNPPKYIDYTTMKFKITVYDIQAEMPALIALTEREIALSIFTGDIITNSFIKQMAAYGMTTIKS